MEVPPQCRFPVPTGDHGVDVAEILAWHRRVLEFIASEAGQSVSEDARLHVQVRGLPDVSGAPAAAHIEDCPLVEVWYPELARRRPPTTRPPRTPRPSPPRFAELLVLSPRRWWQFWRR